MDLNYRSHIDLDLDFFYYQMSLKVTSSHFLSWKISFFVYYKKKIIKTSNLSYGKLFYVLFDDTSISGFFTVIKIHPNSLAKDNSLYTTIRWYLVCSVLIKQKLDVFRVSIKINMIRFELSSTKIKRCLTK